MGKLEKRVISILEEFDGLTLTEIAEKSEESGKKVFKALRKLYEQEKIISDYTSEKKIYKLLKKQEKE